MFQAYRSLYAPINKHVTSQRAILRFLLNHRSLGVPAAPARSDFATALKDVKKAEKNGYYAQILVVEGEK